MSLNPAKLLLGLLTPLIAAASAWLVAAAAKYGVHLDPSGVNALGVAGATAGAAAMVKLIHDVESHPTVAGVAAGAKAGAGAVEALDPGARAFLQDAADQAAKALQAQFNELAAALPASPATPPSPVPVPAAPAPAAPAAPAPAA